jgi:hypothetical protein
MAMDPQTGTVTHQEMKLERLKLDSLAAPIYLGESGYTNDKVVRGVGQVYLPPKAHQMLNANRRVRDLTAQDGAFLARAILRAAAATTAVIPSENSIGGPTRGYLLTPTFARTFDELGL